MHTTTVTPKMADFLGLLEKGEPIQNRVLSRYWRAYNLGWIELQYRTPDEAREAGLCSAAECQKAKKDNTIFVSIPPRYRLTETGEAVLSRYREKHQN